MKNRKKPSSPPSALARFHAFVQGAVGMLGLVILPAALRTKLRPRWGSHVPQLALAIASMIEEAPDLFSWVPWRPERIRGAVARLNELGEIQNAVGQFAAQLGDTLLSVKGELFDFTGEVVQGLDALLKSPATTPEARQRLVQLSAAVFSILSTRNADIQVKRQQSLRGRTSAEERVAEVEAELERTRAELEFVRSGTIRVPQPQPAANRARKARR